MNIFRVLGFGLLIVLLKFLVPEIFAGLQRTLLVFFDALQTILGSAKTSMTAGFLPR